MIEYEELTSREKAAILMITMGKSASAMLYRHLKEDEIEQLTLDISAMRRIDPEVRNSVMNEFHEICIAQQFISEGGLDYAKEILEEAIGPEKTSRLMEKLTTSLHTRPFDFFKDADIDQILNFIQDEHPQTIALILSYLDKAKAASVIIELEDELQTDVVSRIATMGATSPEYIKEAERILERRISSMGTANQEVAGGLDAIVAILNMVDQTTERRILEAMEKEDEELTDEIRSRLFVFEDIAKMDNQAIQRVLRDMDNSDLAIALKGSSKEVTAAIFDNVSKRLQEQLKEDIELMGPVRVRDVEEAQQKIVNMIRRLEDAGEIVSVRGGEDEMIV